MSINNDYLICADGVKCPYCEYWIEKLEKAVGVNNSDVECPNCHKSFILIKAVEYQAYKQEDQPDIMSSLFCKNLRFLRRVMGLTQKSMSELLGIPQPSLSAYENGRNQPTLDVLVALAQKCNVSIDWLCGLSSNRTLR